MYAVMMSWCLR